MTLSSCRSSAASRRVGIALRRRLVRLGAPRRMARSPAGPLLVTGPTSGLGRAATEALAGLGARVILVGRSAERLAALRDELVATHGRGPLPDRRRRHGLARVGAGGRCAGSSRPRTGWTSWSTTPAPSSRSGRVGPDGIEATLATPGRRAVRAGLGACCRCCARRRRRGSSRSPRAGMYTQRLDLDDLQSTEQPYSGPRAYARAKRAQVALVREWARRLGAGSASTSTRCIPAGRTHRVWPSRCPASTDLMRPLLRTPAEGADTIVWLAATRPAGRAAARSSSTGGRGHSTALPATRLSAADRRRLWDAGRRPGRACPIPCRSAERSGSCSWDGASRSRGSTLCSSFV